MKRDDLVGESADHFLQEVEVEAAAVAPLAAVHELLLLLLPRYHSIVDDDDGGAVACYSRVPT